jgi:hypothetical protein
MRWNGSCAQRRFSPETLKSGSPRPMAKGSKRKTALKTREASNGDRSLTAAGAVSRMRTRVGRRGRLQGLDQRRQSPVHASTKKHGDLSRAGGLCRTLACAI